MQEFFRGGGRADQILLLNYLEITLAECQWKCVVRFDFLERGELMNGQDDGILLQYPKVF